MSNEITVFRQKLMQMGSEFKAVLPKHISPDQFTRIAMTAVQRQPQILECTQQSVLAALMRSAEDGLLPDGREAAIIKFGQTAQYLPMVAGILKKVRQSGQLKTISAHVVYTNDEFTYELGDEERIIHKPLLMGERGDFMLVYARAETKDGGVYREVMTKEEVDKVKAASKSAGGPAWTQWYNEMARKSVIKRLSKYLPMSTDDVTRMFESDDDELAPAPQQTVHESNGNGNGHVQPEEPNTLSRTRQVRQMIQERAQSTTVTQDVDPATGEILPAQTQPAKRGPGRPRVTPPVQEQTTQAAVTTQQAPPPEEPPVDTQHEDVMLTAGSQLSDKQGMVYIFTDEHQQQFRTRSYDVALAMKSLIGKQRIDVEYVVEDKLWWIVNFAPMVVTA